MDPIAQEVWDKSGEYLVSWNDGGFEQYAPEGVLTALARKAVAGVAVLGMVGVPIQASVEGTFTLGVACGIALERRRQEMEALNAAVETVAEPDASWQDNDSHSRRVDDPEGDTT